jgi:methylmalonyl-CoA/ethylmalonyl-CoA epimerase
MVIDHIGIVVKSIEKSIHHWKKVFGYVQQTEIITNTRQKVRVVFLTKKDSLSVKLIEPSEPTSTIARLAARGGGLHHLCFRCGNIEETLVQMKAMDLRILSPPEPGEAFALHDIAFLYSQGVNIELIDTDERAGMIKE